MHVLYGLAMVWLGCAIAVDGFLSGAPSWRFGLSRVGVAGILLAIGGVIYATGALTRSMPLPGDDGDGPLSSAWLWYGGVALMTAAAVIRTLGVIDSLRF
ncbi:hypothetical protein EA473_19105 [Natrarchaeobius chitinivorans]|uniref:Uncharacterized protein n=1 Tax=Natrarchaeobius chitinivorans TaxID=1679083 RepID=A0A3N6MZM5_NATCH|nr:hypothetical protein EA473_19105 [Natrarchaeobius chitinivorans]